MKRLPIAHLLSMLPHGLEDVGHFLPLPLGPDVRANPLLEELEAALVLGDPQQLHCSAFVRGEASYLTHKVSDKPRGNKYFTQCLINNVKIYVTHLLWLVFLPLLLAGRLFSVLGVVL